MCYVPSMDATHAQVVIELEYEYATRVSSLVDRLNSATGSGNDDLQMLRFELIHQLRAQRGDAAILIEQRLDRLDSLIPQLQNLTTRWTLDLTKQPALAAWQHTQLLRDICTLEQWNDIAQCALSEQGVIRS